MLKGLVLHIVLLAQVVAAASCAGRTGTDAAQGASPAPAACESAEAVTRAFYTSLAAMELDRVSALSSFPFDLDAHNGCIESAQELSDALAKQLQKKDVRIQLGEIRPVTKTTKNLPAAILDKLPRFLADDAPCRHRADGADSKEPPATFTDFWVEFSVNGQQVGALTRVRCEHCICRVAALDN